MQKSDHQEAKLQLLECKVTPIMVQSYKHQDATPNFFDYNLKYIPSINGGFFDWKYLHLPSDNALLSL